MFAARTETRRENRSLRMVQLRPLNIHRSVLPKQPPGKAAFGHSVRTAAIDSTAARRAASRAGRPLSASNPADVALNALASPPMSTFRDAQPRWPEASASRGAERKFAQALHKPTPPTPGYKAMSREVRAKLYLDGHQMFVGVDPATQAAGDLSSAELKDGLNMVVAIAEGEPPTSLQTEPRPPAPAGSPRPRTRGALGQVASKAPPTSPRRAAMQALLAAKRREAHRVNVYSCRPASKVEYKVSQAARASKSEGPAQFEAETEYNEVASSLILQQPGATVGLPPRVASSSSWGDKNAQRMPLSPPVTTGKMYVRQERWF